MYKLRVFIAEKDAKVYSPKEDKIIPSAAGHVWYEIEDYTGKIDTFGFAPETEGVPLGAGVVHDTDTLYYKNKSYIGEMDITAEQHAKLFAFGTSPKDYSFSTFFNGAGNSCIDFTWKALEVAGLNPDKFEGEVWPVDNADNFKDIGFVPVTEAALRDRLFNEEFNYVSKLFFEAQNAGSPLVLDLDGDGVEVSSLAYGAAGSHVYFDMDNDGVGDWKTRSPHGGGDDKECEIWLQTYSNNNAEFGKSQAA